MSGDASGDAPVCGSCGHALAIGDWPFCPHDRPAPYHPFIPYFDISMGRQINSLADRWRGMRELKLDHRDQSSPGDLSARRDRIEQAKRERAR